MSADLLREAAQKMRELADEATPGPWAWESVSQNDNGWCLGVVWDENERPLSGHIQPGAGDVVEHVCEKIFANHSRDAAHIAAWHPDVARAAANLLTAEAKRMDENTIVDRPESGEYQPLNPEALWCYICGGAVESPHYTGKDQACHCWDAVLAFARAFLGDGGVPDA